MAGFRIDRLNEDIMRELAALMRDRVKDPRVDVSTVSIVRTDLSNDGSHCKVYVSSLGGIEAARTAVRGLESASGLLRKEVANKLKMKKCPEFKFIADDSIEFAANIDKLIQK